MSMLSAKKFYWHGVINLVEVRETWFDKGLLLRG
jgi:hypothetical protein